MDIRDNNGRFAKKRKQGEGEKNPNWKGDDVSIYGLHAWLVRKYGKPQKCEVCGTTTAKRFDWACLNERYIRDRSCFIRLCRSCHVKMDKNFVKKNKAVYKKYEPVNIQISCKTCGKTIFVRSKNRQYCSKYCWYHRNEQVF